ncbi:MAG: methyltransferase domain-containing protein [Geminicoccaceae bacterium]|nr:methyltransferase domain-containing protein [Geminicoccaceae bacterium]MDW8370994.1 methyltransferase domain-containing protein [Geminicoccaceae bacterium]
MRLHPDMAAGGGAYDADFVSYSLHLRCLPSPTMRVLDFGAGRDRFGEDDSDSLVARLARLRGRCGEVVGFDVAAVVLDDPLLDRAEHAPPGACLPFADGSFDPIVSSMVFEDVEKPSFFGCELDRVLRPRGRLCAAGPDTRGLPAVARPESCRTPFMPRPQTLGFDPTRDRLLPTFDPMNTRGRLRALFPARLDCSYRRLLARSSRRPALVRTVDEVPWPDRSGFARPVSARHHAGARRPTQSVTPDGFPRRAVR